MSSNVYALAAAMLLAASPETISAQAARRVVPATRTAPARAMRPASATPPETGHPVRLGPHTYYGTIASIAGTTVTLRTRHQRLVAVDASNVLADGTYSAPLFVGKLVTVDGTRAAGGVFTAAHILRMTNLNALPDDH